MKLIWLKSEDIQNLLHDKYGEEFEVSANNGRYGTAKNDTVTTFVHPMDNPELVFSAVMDKEGELVTDGYIPRLISNSINHILKQELQAAGIESETFVYVINADSSSEANSNISLKEYVSEYKPGHFSAHMIVKETPNLTAEQFKNAVTAVYNESANTTFQMVIRVISEDEYEKCLEKFKELPKVTKAWFADYNVVDEMKLIIDSNGFPGYSTKLIYLNSNGEGE